MRVEQIPEGGRHYDIFDGNKIVASIRDNERLARQFAASDEMLAILKDILAHPESTRLGLDGGDYCGLCWDAMDDDHDKDCPLAQARELVARVEK